MLSLRALISTLLLCTLLFVLINCQTLEDKPQQKIENTLAKIMGMSFDDKDRIKINAIELGYPVTYSTAYDFFLINYRLDYDGGNYRAWAPLVSRPGQWIQVMSQTPQFWTGLLLQGRKDYSAWVKTLQVKYSMNGRQWRYVQNGAIFNANSDRNTKVPIDFKIPVYARALRIYPVTWHEFMNLRFEAFFLDIQ